MFRFSRAVPVFLAWVLSTIAALPLLAQERQAPPIPLAEISGGYMFMRDVSADLPGANGVNFPAGWYFSGAVNATRWFAVVGEASGSAKNNFNASMMGYNFSNNAHVYTALGGPRFFRQFGRVVPFGQMLVGVAHMRLRTRFPDELAVGTVTHTATDVAFQPGGGLTVYLTDHVGVRLAGDYRTIVDFVSGEENDYTNEFRVVAGFTLHWGVR